ncbi:MULTISPECIES: leucine-rich repeat-containing protein kinase family protein [unclassified Herbaspirillum]|uniref:leucine-rich repeat-containing protein kinase family protein n=1 Tax=unclassified Herbaspirillum TaxID=2624150 RepID=UPI001153C297|nr:MULTISPECIES: leucine-rich repeat-containing protein kinase family protein [unclassified Herbaspirillum]
MHTLEQLRSGALAGIKRLSLSCGLREFPREIFNLADTLEILDLSGNQLSALPDDLPRLHQLRIIFCSDNAFTELPAVLGRCARLEMIGFKANRIGRVPGAALPAALRWLVLTDNRIEALPPEIGHCTRLQKLMLAGNRLRSLPSEMANCRRLELLRLAVNRFEAFPEVLAALPRLSWLAVAGNPFCAEFEAAVDGAAQAPPVEWRDLELLRKLGEGASGVIHEARWRTGSEARAVAVKLFKGEVTSDGLPRREMAAAIAAGDHQGLIPVLGRLRGHPDSAHGLVMPLIAPSFVNLAGPPSLVSCTRDVYAEETVFEWRHALGVARDVAAAVAHLHRRGVVHGDLYAHNILHRAPGSALLGDFGAASLCDPAAPYAAALQAMEARAFGCLLEELLQRCALPGLEPVIERLGRLRDRCRSEAPGDRPDFDGIARELAAAVASLERSSCAA